MAGIGPVFGAVGQLYLARVRGQYSHPLEVLQCARFRMVFGLRLAVIGEATGGKYREARASRFIYQLQ